MTFFLPPAEGRSEPQISSEDLDNELPSGGGEVAGGGDGKKWPSGDVAARMVDGFDRVSGTGPEEGAGAAGFDDVGFGLAAKLVNGGVGSVAPMVTLVGFDAITRGLRTRMLRYFKVALVPSFFAGHGAGRRAGSSKARLARATRPMPMLRLTGVRFRILPARTRMAGVIWSLTWTVMVRFMVGNSGNGQPSSRHCKTI